MIIRRPDILRSLVGRLGAKSNYPNGRVARLCRDLYTDFREFLFRDCMKSLEKTK
jgi:hypothetical protein